jgi:hypothetical protein
MQTRCAGHVRNWASAASGRDNDKSTQVQIEAILDCRAVHLGHETACRGQRRAIEADFIADRDQLLRRLPRGSRGRILGRRQNGQDFETRVSRAATSVHRKLIVNCWTCEAGSLSR